MTKVKEKILLGRIETLEKLVQELRTPQLVPGMQFLAHKQYSAPVPFDLETFRSRIGGEVGGLLTYGKRNVLIFTCSPAHVEFTSGTGWDFYHYSCYFNGSPRCELVKTLECGVRYLLNPPEHSLSMKIDPKLKPIVI